jgi:hypothetical protein
LNKKMFASWLLLFVGSSTAQLLIDFPRVNESYAVVDMPVDVLLQPTFQFREGFGPIGVWARNDNGSWCSTMAVTKNFYGWFPVTTPTNRTRLRFASNITWLSGDSLNVLIDGLVSIYIDTVRVAILASRQKFSPGDGNSHVQLENSWTLAMCDFNVPAGGGPPRTFTVEANFVGGGSLQDFNVTITWATRNCTFVGWQNATLTAVPINRSSLFPFRLHAKYRCLFCIDSVTLMGASNSVASTTRSPVTMAIGMSRATVVGTQSSEPTTSSSFSSGAVMPVSASPPNVALIAGLSALGVVVLLGLLGAAFLLLRRSNQKQAASASASTTSSSNTGTYGSVLTALS